MDGNSTYTESGCVRSGPSTFSTRGPKESNSKQMERKKKSPKAMKKANDFLGDRMN